MPSFTQPQLLPSRLRLLIGILLLAAMYLTRGHHFVSAVYLPSASLAVFFLAGRYLRHWFSWPGFFLAAFAFDYALISYKGTSNYCMTLSYAFLILSYGAMWLAGFYSQGLKVTSVPSLLHLAAIASLATLLAFVISNGAFYWLSGRYPEANWAEYLQRFFHYLPAAMAKPWFWLGISAVSEGVFSLVRRDTLARKLSA